MPPRAIPFHLNNDAFQLRVEFSVGMTNSGRRILIVDDEPSLLKMMSVYLDRLGYAVTALSSTDAAWREVEASPADFAVAVLDGSMPGMSMEALALRLLRANPAMCVVAASGYPVDMTTVEAAAPGRVAFLAKPFSPKTLAATVRRMSGAPEEEV
jgi:two-component system cell cycle sensor histidine kinase/response regulator CckA